MYSKKTNKNYFNKGVNQYDSELVKHPPLHTVLETSAIINLLKKNIVNNVADFGSGTGRLTYPLLRQGYKVSAIDVSNRSLIKLKKLAGSYGYQIKLFKSFNNLKYDAVVGCDVLHHVILATELRNIFNAVKKNGTVVFSEPGAFNPSWYLYFIIKGGWQYEKGLTSCSYFNLMKVFGGVGFKKIKIFGLGILPRSLVKTDFLCRLNDWLGNLPVLKFFAYRYLISACK